MQVTFKDTHVSAAYRRNQRTVLVDGIKRARIYSTSREATWSRSYEADHQVWTLCSHGVAQRMVRREGKLSEAKKWCRDHAGELAKDVACTCGQGESHAGHNPIAF